MRSRRNGSDQTDEVQTTHGKFNVRTLSETSRKKELITCTILNKIDVLYIQEHRFYHETSDPEYTTINIHQLITASASKNTEGSRIGGVGILLIPRASSNLLDIEKISDRIVVTEFNSNPKTTVILCYSPTNTNDEPNVDAFYKDLKLLLDNIPTHNFLVIAGEFNAQIGPLDALFSYNKETNRKGEKLVDLVEEYHLTVTNTRFMKSSKKLWTFQHSAGHRS